MIKRYYISGLLKSSFVLRCIILKDNHRYIVYYLQLYLNYYSCKCYFASSLKWYSHGHVVKKFLYGIAKTIVILLAWVMMPFRIWSVYISGVLYQTKMLQCNTLYLFHRNHLVLSLPFILWAKTIGRLFVSWSEEAFSIVRLE